MVAAFSKALLLGGCVIRIKGLNLSLIRFNSMMKIAQTWSKFCIFTSSNLFLTRYFMRKIVGYDAVTGFKSL